MLCYKCFEKMYPFRVELKRMAFEGHVCPECGHWTYKREVKHESLNHNSSKSFVCLRERGRGVRKELDKSNIDSMVEV